jgi:orotidine-5'-phosphate decarboxylase
VANLRGRGIGFLTVHGDRAILQAAAGEKGEMRILAVTLLTSIGPAELRELGFAGEVQDLVLARARGALEAGCDGVICSGLEAPALRSEFGARLLRVTPGIRPAGAGAGDQKRVVDVAQACAGGADYIVVGRPVRDAPDPHAAAEAIQRTIASIFPA